MKEAAANSNSPRTYWPKWLIGVMLVWFFVAPVLLVRLLGVNGAVAFQLGWAPCLIMMALFEPGPQERDPETGLPLPRTREAWARAWRKALTEVGIILAISVPLYFWLLA